QGRGASCSASFTLLAHSMAPEVRPLEPPRLALGQDEEVLSALPPAVKETITQARAPGTTRLYAFKWRLFSSWCSSRGEDLRRILIGLVLSFLQERLENNLSPSTLKVYVATIAAHHNLVEVVQEAWAGKNVYVLLSKIGPYKIFFADISKTAPQKELESEVINAYMCLLVRRFNAQSKEQAFQIDSFEMTDIWNGKNSKLKVDPRLYRYLISIVNDHYHWTVVVMLPSQRNALFLDPLGESSAKLKQCENATTAFMRQKGCNFSRWSCDTLPHPKQQDGTSCGVFALKFAECVLREETIVFRNTPEGVEELRKAIAVTLLQNSDDLSQLCHLCGEESGDINWSNDSSSSAFSSTAS
ncbi:putative sentrin-specific protease-like, partial [Triplophysa rosa]